MKKATSRPRLASAAALRLIGAAVRKTRPPERGADDVATAEYLYVPCARVRYCGSLAETSRWVLEVPVIRKTAKRIYYTSDSWDRIEAVVSPGCISRQEFEDGTPAGVTPIPGARPGSAGLAVFRHPPGRRAPPVSRGARASRSGPAGPAAHQGTAPRDGRRSPRPRRHDGTVHRSASPLSDGAAARTAVTVSCHDRRAWPAARPRGRARSAAGPGRSAGSRWTTAARAGAARAA